MMAKPVRGFQINTILDRLALDMLGILQGCLVTAPLDRDRLHLAILLTLSRRVYVEGLLYRDYRVDRDSQWYSWSLPDGSERPDPRAGHRLPAQGPGAASQARPPAAAHEPGNMQLLLGLLCRYGPAEHGWRAAELRRDASARGVRRGPDFVEHVALELAAQRARLGDDVQRRTPSAGARNTDRSG